MTYKNLNIPRPPEMQSCDCCKNKRYYKDMRYLPGNNLISGKTLCVVCYARHTRGYCDTCGAT